MTEPLPADATAVPPRARVDLFYDGRWNDVTGDDDTAGRSRVRREPGASITWGRPAGRDEPMASTCSLTLSNRDGRYSRRNPRSALRRKLGKNTPARVSRRILTDAFNRTESSGWDTADTGQPYFEVAGDAADFTVAGGYASIAMDATGTSWVTSVPDIQLRDVAITTSVKPGMVATGGGAIQISITARRQDEDNFYRVVAFFNDDSTARLLLMKIVASSSTTVAVSSVIPYDANSEMGLEFNVCGNVLQGWLWDLSDPASVTSIEDTDTDLTEAGSVSVRAVVGTGGTVPHTVSIGPLEVLSVRFAGEIPALPVRWDVSGTDVTVPVTAAGIMQRLAQSGRQPQTAIRRYLERLDPAVDNLPVACWPLEEGPLATKASPLFGQYDMITIPLGSHPTAGTIRTVAQWGRANLGPRFRPGVSLAGNAQLSVIWAPVIMGSNLAGTMGVEFLYAGTTDSSNVIIDLNPTYLGGASANWPQLVLDCNDASVNVTLNGAAATVEEYPLLFDGNPHWVRWVLTIVGADTEWETYIDGVLVNSGTQAGYLIPSIEWIAFLSLVSTGTPSAVQWLIVWQDSLPDGSQEAGTGYPAERAATRFARLCAEEGITAVTIGDADDSAVMGPQRLATALDLIKECATADQGILFEPRGLPGLGYRTRVSLENPVADLELDYSAHHLSEAPEPADDTFDLANDVTASDVLEGAEERRVIREGALGVDAIGTYAPSNLAVSTNSRWHLGSVAGWRAHLGTHDEESWPRVALDLARAPFAASQFLVDGVLDRRAGDTASVANPPDWLSPEDIFVMLVGGTEDLRAGQHIMAWFGEPARAYQIAVLEDDDLGVLDSDGTTTVAEFLTGTDTELDVTVADGRPYWVTGSVGIDVMVDGVRLAVTSIGSLFTDTFTRVASSGWANGWTVHGGAASLYSADGTRAIVSMEALNSSRRTLRPDADYLADIDHLISIDVAFTPTGANADASLTARVDPDDIGNTYYYAEMEITPTNTVTARLVKRVSAVETGLTTAVTVAGLTHASGTPLWMRMRVVGESIQMKVAASRADLLDPMVPWTASATDSSITAAGRHGTRGVLNTGLTNVLPVTYRWDDYEVIMPQRMTVTAAPVNGITGMTLATGGEVHVYPAPAIGMGS